MKNFLIIFMLLLFIICGINSVFAENYKNIEDGAVIGYETDSGVWVSENPSENAIIVKKSLYGETPAYSEYYTNDNMRAFALAADYEFIKDGNLICIDNNMLKYSKIIYDGESFREITIPADELKAIFPDYDIVYVSEFNNNKLCLEKDFFKKKTVIIYNDTDKCLYKLRAKCKKAQKNGVKGIITFYRFGVFRFTHFGERNGKLTVYVY